MIFFLSSIPGSDLKLPKLIPHSDKIAHFFMYAILGALVLRAGRDEWTASRRWGWLAVCFILGSAYGATDEWHQIFVEDRDCSLVDWIVDSLGILSGEWGRLVVFRYISPK